MVCAGYFDDVFLSYVQHNGMPGVFVWIEDAWLAYIGEEEEEEEGVKELGGGTGGEQRSSSARVLPLKAEAASGAVQPRTVKSS